MPKTPKMLLHAIWSKRCSFCLFLVTSKLAACQSSAKMLNKWNLWYFDMKSNYVDPGTPKKFKSFEKLDKKMIKFQKRIL